MKKFKDHPDTLAWREWEKSYQHTSLRLYSSEVGERTWRLRTTHSDIAERLKRKVGFHQTGFPVRGFPPWWEFQTEYSSRGNAIRSLSRIVRTPCEWDSENEEIVASNPEGEN